MSRDVCSNWPATFAVALIAGLLYAGTAEAQILKREPAPGALRFGQRVLVDDGSCPRGQIKQVSAGNNIGGPETRPGRVQRTRRCIAR